MHVAYQQNWISVIWWAICVSIGPDTFIWELTTIFHFLWIWICQHTKAFTGVWLFSLCIFGSLFGRSWIQFDTKRWLLPCVLNLELNKISKVKNLSATSTFFKLDVEIDLHTCVDFKTCRWWKKGTGVIISFYFVNKLYGEGVGVGGTISCFLLALSCP